MSISLSTTIKEISDFNIKFQDPEQRQQLFIEDYIQAISKIRDFFKTYDSRFGHPKEVVRFHAESIQIYDSLINYILQKKDIPVRDPKNLF